MATCRALLAAAFVLASVSACGGGDRSSPPAETGPRGDLYRPPPSPTVEIHNACADAVPVYFGEQPNGSGGGDFVTLRGSGTSHVERREHGELTVWIVDDKGFGLAHVKVSRKMSKVEIGPSCRTLHAD